MATSGTIVIAPTNMSKIGISANGDIDCSKAAVSPELLGEVYPHLIALAAPISVTS